jgi:hypothetical protein
MIERVFKAGPFKGVAESDAFARAALQQSAVTVEVGPVPWPAGLGPVPAPLGNYRAGESILTAVRAPADVLIVLYTNAETSALLDVLTGSNAWTPARKKTWNGYGHNFAQFKPIIDGIEGDPALENGLFGYLSALRIGTKNVVLFKSELHPKQNGTGLPFVRVLAQLIDELQPGLVISTGTAGAIGSTLRCGDVAITSAARFHVASTYPDDPQINTLSATQTELSNSPAIDPAQIAYAAENFTKLSLDGLAKCYTALQRLPGYGFVQPNAAAPSIYVTGNNPVPGPQPMAIVTADYLTVDDSSDAEGLQPLGIMNDTDDAFAFYAIGTLSGTKPAWLSVRNASEPQIVAPPFAPGTPASEEIDKLKAIAGSIYGIYQYCTTLNSAFACWGVVAGMP